MTEKKKRLGLLRQVALLFTVVVIFNSFIVYLANHLQSDAAIRKETEENSAEVAREVGYAIREYPAYRWLISYWHDNAKSLSIEYDADYGTGTKTEAKCRALCDRYPDLVLKYVNEEDLENMSAVDRKVYAEIAYSWLITRVDQIKQTFGMDYLFCVLSEEPYDHQFFLFSGADKDSVRGYDYEDVYPLGKEVDVGADQQTAMREAETNQSHLAAAGSYVDYYYLFDKVDGYTVLIGQTYNLSDLKTDMRNRALQDTTVATVQQILLALFCLLMTNLAVIKPLKKVQSSIRRYKDTKDSELIGQELKDLRTGNEIGDLADDVIDLTKDIDIYLKEIRSNTREKERTRTELNLATRIQASMLPREFPPFPERKEFDLYASMDPAKAVAGDFYDFFLIDEDHLCLAIADVSGKGIPAALFMMITMLILRSYARQGLPPEEVLNKTNETICARNGEQMFVSIWIGILEISSGKMRAADAGHEYPCIKRAGGDFEIMKDLHGLVIGAMEDITYKGYDLQLQAGDEIFVYTDGVPEATDAEDHLFGDERMLEALNQDRQADPESLLRNVTEAIDRFVGEAAQFDDITMLAFRYNGEASMNELTLEASIDNVEKITAFVDARLEELGCPFKEMTQIDIAIDEIFSNIAKYAYAPGKGNATVSVEAEDDPRAVIITFRDNGQPYDPLSTDDPDVTLPAEERKIGGLGVFVVKKTMDDVKYEYRDGQNILRIRKEIG